MYVHIYTLAIIKFYEKYCFFLFLFSSLYLLSRAHNFSRECELCESKLHKKYLKKN